MRRQAYIRPSRLNSTFGAIIGVIMLLVGIGFFLHGVGDSRTPGGAYLFMAIWFCVALAGTIYNIYNATTGQGYAANVVDYDEPDPGPPRDPAAFQSYSVLDRLPQSSPPTATSAKPEDSIAARLRQLQDLLAQNLVTQAEFDQKRAEILKEP